MTDRCEHLVDRLRSVLEKGLPLESAALHFLEDVLPQQDSATLQRMLADPSDADSATVGEWIFSPDAFFQQRIEPLLASDPFSAEEVERAVRLLQRRPPCVRLILSSWRQELNLFMPAAFVEPFVTALRLFRAMPQRVLSCLERFPDPALRMAVRVCIRNRRMEMTVGNISFLSTFLQSVPVNEPEILPCADLICELLEEGGTPETMASLLADRKRLHFRSLKSVERHREKLRRHNIETLMMTGERTPHVDPEAARSGMRRIDVISSACFGETFAIEDAAVRHATVSRYDPGGFPDATG
ncbi:MAG: hypothetical protein LJE65_12900 [Desulfobacteraceae bacterium]|nr:hypothetical protein [Desulfobacteraceae bacterium]